MAFLRQWRTWNLLIEGGMTKYLIGMARNLHENCEKPIGKDGQHLKTLHNKKRLVAGMVKNRCIIYKACRFAGVDRTTFYDYYRTDPDFKSKIDELTEAEIDDMEASLKRKAALSDAANIFWLKCKGRKRGWNERIGVDISPEGVFIPNDIVDNAVEAALKAAKERLKAADED